MGRIFVEAELHCPYALANGN